MIHAPETLTTLKIVCSIDALPGPCASTKHAARRPARAFLRARAATEQAPLTGGLAGWTRAGSHTVAIADHVRRGADTGGRVRWGRGRVAVQASEPAGVITDASWHAYLGVVAGLR